MRNEPPPRTGRLKLQTAKQSRLKRKALVIDSDSDGDGNTKEDDVGSAIDVDAMEDKKTPTMKSKRGNKKIVGAKKLKAKVKTPPPPRALTPPTEAIDSSSDMDDTPVTAPRPRTCSPPNPSAAPPPPPPPYKQPPCGENQNHHHQSSHNSATQPTSLQRPFTHLNEVPSPFFVSDVPTTTAPEFLSDPDDAAYVILDDELDDIDFAEIDALSSAAPATSTSMSSFSQPHSQTREAATSIYSSSAAMGTRNGVFVPPARHRPLGEWFNAYASQSSKAERDKDGAKQTAEVLGSNASLPVNGPGVLWYDKYEPSCEVDLATGKKKVAEVKEWLQRAIQGGGKPRILLLHGPSGGGKSTTVRVLARSLDIELVEWVTGVDDASFESRAQENDGDVGARWRPQWWSPDDFNRTATSKFVEFLRQADKYPALAFVDGRIGPVDDDGGGGLAPALALDPHRSSSHPRVILLDDLPNLSHPTVRTAFHAALTSYVSSPRSRNPIVIVTSNPGGDFLEEQGRRGAGAKLGGAFTHKSVVPADVRSGRYGRESFAEIEFKSVAPTFVVKALERIATQEGLDVDTAVLEVLADGCGGDVRSAVGAMQFWGVGRAKGRGFAGGKGKKKGTMKDRVRMAKAAMPGGIGFGRESTLFMFHALGKILHNKREEGQTPASQTVASLAPSFLLTQTPTPLPPHMSHLDRPVPLKYNPDDVLESTHVDPHHLVSCLHQNYLPFFSDVDGISDAADCLSDADLLIRTWSTDDTMGPYATMVASRGILYAYPVGGEKAGGGMRQIYMPESYRATREARENDEQVEAVMRTCQESWMRSEAGVSFSRNDFKLEILPALKSVLKSGSDAPGRFGERRARAPLVLESGLSKTLIPLLRRLATFSTNARKPDAIAETDISFETDMMENLRLGGERHHVSGEWLSGGERIKGGEITFLVEDDIVD
ncbi:Cell cycle checkpoint protein rad17 [Gonapodya sp. JEL0774]|nr:Cell cycle checkpoint protein rad17 [Gonapodya sp. JEL0774]